MTAQHLTQPVDGPFSLAAAMSFGFGPHDRQPGAPGGALMRMAFVADDLRHHAGAVLTELPGGSIDAEICGAVPASAAGAQVRRVLSVDVPAGEWVAAGQADPVLGAVQAAHPGLRPVLYYSPYEAAAWCVLSQRRHHAQATALRRQLSEKLGTTVVLAGRTEAAFPLPEQLLAVTEFPGVEPARLDRLHGVARAALDGQLDAARLRTLPAGEAMAELQQIKGLGPMYATLVYLRSTGVTDELTHHEPRLASYLQHYYGLAAPPGDAEVAQIAEQWRPFRTWAAVLFRAAGDRDKLPLARPARR